MTLTSISKGNESISTAKCKLTSNALWASLSIHIIAWSDVALQERTMRSNLPSTGTAVLTRGGYLPHLQQSGIVSIKFLNYVSKMKSKITIFFKKFIL